MVVVVRGRSSPLLVAGDTTSGLLVLHVGTHSANGCHHEDGDEDDSNSKHGCPFVGPTPWGCGQLEAKGAPYTS